ncbi:helix-turn-helix domain-containing protein [Chitinophaga niabensis]|uniref:AraC-type DNA-binding protein n=1 Tax=Chitinophaga niabensis TaxID=536979 RepID=A0A1N6E3H1_9BACT|nr:AraC-type DNA-binding protein [Chitinophaga niabensis]
MMLSDTDTKTIHQVRHLIQCRVFQHIKITDLLLDAEMRESKLSKGFRSLYGVTISHYHLTISMEYGKALLESGAMVKEVAIKLGYRTTGNFSRAFVKIFGKPPSNFQVHK